MTLFQNSLKTVAEPGLEKDNTDISNLLANITVPSTSEEEDTATITEAATEDLEKSIETALENLEGENTEQTTEKTEDNDFGTESVSNPIIETHLGHIALEEYFIQSNRFNSSIAHLKDAAVQIEMIDNYKKVIEDHPLSAPVIAVMHATPGFDEAVSDFPEPSLYNVIPEHKSSARFGVAVEALSVAVDGGTTAVTNAINEVVIDFDKALDAASYQVPLFQKHLDDARMYLSKTEMTDDILTDMSFKTMSNEAFVNTFNALDEQLGNITTFDTSAINETPSMLKQEIDGMSVLVGNVGGIFGISTYSYGLKHSDKDEMYQTVETCFSAHDHSMTSLAVLIDKASMVVDKLGALTERRRELVDALYAHNQIMPTVTTGNEETYGMTDHIALVSSYVVMTVKLVDETIGTVSRLITLINGIRSQEMMINTQEIPE